MGRIDKSWLGLGCLPIIREAERHLPAHRLYSILKPVLFARATLNTVFKPPKSAPPLPGFLSGGQAVQRRIQQRATHYLNEILRYFPDRLGEASWKDHCRIEGLARLEEARREGRGVVLAFCHFGAFYLLHVWLRVCGFPASVFVQGESAKRTRLKRAQDRLFPLPQIPVALYQDQLRETAQLLMGGNLLVIAVDIRAVRQIEVPFGEGWTLQMATGALRFASRHQAQLMPCSITDEGAWHFRMKIGRPVPEKYLRPQLDAQRAGEHLIEEMRPDFQAHPGQCWTELTRSLKPSRLASALDR